MNWHRSPELLDRLAAEYALGTLAGGARRRFEAVMRNELAVARAAARWATRLEPMGAELPPLDAGGALWSRIERSSFGTVSATHSRPGWVQRIQRLFAPVPAAALSLGLVLGLGVPLAWRVLQQDVHDTQLPDSYVGVLAEAAGRPGLIVSSLRRGRTVDLKVVHAVALPPGKVLVLWTLDAKGTARAVGPLPGLDSGFVSMTLDEPAEAAFARAVELAVSMETAGITPQTPTPPFVYRGLCGKLWRVK